MEEVYKIIDFLDDCRWNTTEREKDSENNIIEDNYYKINYANKEIDNDSKLLIHWICYIADRQMKFRKIWAVGGFVFSDMVENYKKNGVEAILKNDGINFKKDDNDELAFIASREAGKNEILNKYYEKKDNDSVDFKPRCFASEYVSIVYTLYTLEKISDKSFVKYIIMIINNIIMSDLYKNNKELQKQLLIRGIAYGLYLLTYEDIGSPKKENLENNKWTTKLWNNAEKRSENLKNLLTGSDKNKFCSEIEPQFYKSKKTFKSKRLWCALRDYIKSQEYGNALKTELTNSGLDTDIVNDIFSKEAKQYLELPGDVWNNNNIFRKCIVKDCAKLEVKTNKKMNEFLRELYEKELTFGYPEQFDVTFDFVPRMCDVGNCDICPFGLLKDKSNESSIDLCIDKKGKYCPVVLACCNFKYKCQGKNNCKLKWLYSKK